MPKIADPTTTYFALPQNTPTAHQKDWLEKITDVVAFPCRLLGGKTVKAENKNDSFQYDKPFVPTWKKVTMFVLAILAFAGCVAAGLTGFMLPAFIVAGSAGLVAASALLGAITGACSDSYQERLKTVNNPAEQSTEVELEVISPASLPERLPNHEQLPDGPEAPPLEEVTAL